MVNGSRFHPIYISNSSEGAYGQLKPEQQQAQQVYAGIAYTEEGYPQPLAAGRYCEWAHKSVDKAAQSETFQDYMKTLRLECDDGDPAYLNWTVPKDAPDTLYYQVETESILITQLEIATFVSVLYA